jgi:hypothetical protein
MATLLELRTRVRSYLDEPDARFWTDAELNNWINQAYFFAYMEFVQAFENYFATVVFQNITAGVDTYALPANFDKFRLLERVINNTVTIPLQEFNRIETSNLISSFTATNSYLPTYRFVGPNFVLEPMPQVTITNGLRLEYVPGAAPLVADGDSPVSTFLNQWQELIVLKAVVSAKLKEEMTGNQGADLGPFQVMLETWENKVKDAIALRSQSRKYTEPFGIDETSNYYYP